MQVKGRLLAAAVAAACAAPLAALAQSAPQGELVVITITPVEQRVMDEQRRESLFRALDANGDGQVSMAEAGVNTQLLGAFQKLDRNSNRSIDRAEFARVHVDDGSQPAQAAAGDSSRKSPASRSSIPPSSADESWQIHRGQPLPSRSIEERSRHSIPPR